MTSLVIITIILIVLMISNKNIVGMYLLNYFLGFMLIVSFDTIMTKNYSGSPQGHGSVLILVFYLFIFTLFSLGSLLSWIDKENRRLHYFVVPILIYLLIFGCLFLNDYDAFGGMLSLAFFPSHIYSYFKLKKLGKL